MNHVSTIWQALNTKSNRKTDSETQRKSAGETQGQIPHNA